MSDYSVLAANGIVRLRGLNRPPSTPSVFGFGEFDGASSLEWVAAGRVRELIIDQALISAGVWSFSELGPRRFHGGG